MGRNSKWLAIHRQLIKNVKYQNYTPPSEIAVCDFHNSELIVLPAYIPYIGSQYFDYRPRVLCYAINQNLSRHTQWTKDWVTKWCNNLEMAIDRLNISALYGEALPMKPYAEGFMPMVALIVIHRWIRKHSGKLPKTVDNVIAATNFIKFSTSVDASSSSIPNSWWRECGNRYVSYELKLLQPDIVIAFGQKTELEVSRIIDGMTMIQKPAVLPCRFPARIPSDKGRPLAAREENIWLAEFNPLLKRLGPPKSKCYHERKIERYRGYFLDTVTKLDIKDNAALR